MPILGNGIQFAHRWVGGCRIPFLAVVIVGVVIVGVVIVGAVVIVGVVK